MNNSIVEWAMQVAEAELRASLPRWWAHIQGMAGRAGEIGSALGKDSAMLVSAATPHDVGYAPRLV